MTMDPSSSRDNWGPVAGDHWGNQPRSALRWQASYDLASVERFLASVDEECASLRAEIGEAEARTRRANAAAARRTAADAELGARLSAAHQEAAAMEHEHRRIVEMIVSVAEQEAARIVDAAYDEAAILRAAASVASDPGHHPPGHSNGHGSIDRRHDR
jgi:cell division septum initiation protein DivIVA